MNNLFCKLSDLSNEASVESYFIDRLLHRLGFEDKHISLKANIAEYAIGKGSKKSLFKPDYVIHIDGIPAIVIDAKSPNENIINWEHQCSSYCLEINKEFDYNPVKYYILSNGVQTNLYIWDQKRIVTTLKFADFDEGNEKFVEFCSMLSKNSIVDLSEKLKEKLEICAFKFEKVTLNELSQKFQKLHQEIWQSEKKGPSAAFQELIKIFFVKIRKDRDIHLKLGKNPKPKYKDVVFSQNWIATQSESKNPINDILFKNLIAEFERDIISGSKKRFFEKYDQINISASTLKKVVKEIENIDLFGMEEDIHGRMFETFLDATIRGKDIGQFFTPRDIVELMVDLGNPKATKSHIDSVLDACCGSGGFLITSLQKMLQQIENIKGLSSKEREQLQNQVKTKSIYGIDAGSDPAMYKIARMNMYLHGDGGSNIYYADSLDKGIGRIGSENLEVDRQIEELRKMIIEKGKKFDLILSNPPFSLQYSRDNKEQANVLNQYVLSRDRAGGKIINKLISSVMFIERYKDLIEDSGKIIAVIDDSILSGTSFKYIREYIRENFLIEAIISLPGDAFRRAAARVKTSVIILKKKLTGETQEDIFLASSIYLGLETKIAKRIGINIKELEKNKMKEKATIVSNYHQYLQGNDSAYVFPFSNCQDRLDVKYCIKDRGRKANYWTSKGHKVNELGKILNLASNRSVCVKPDTQYPLLIVNYDGEINNGEILDGAESSYSKLYKVKTWDLLISNMGFGRGAISVVPPVHHGKFVSNEYTILTAPTNECAIFYWHLLRTKEILGDIFSSTTGMNRGRIKWEIIKTVLVPIYEDNEEIIKLTAEIINFWDSYSKYLQSKEKHVKKVSNELDISGKDSYIRWLSFKPPE